MVKLKKIAHGGRWGGRLRGRASRAAAALKVTAARTLGVLQPVKFQCTLS